MGYGFKLANITLKDLSGILSKAYLIPSMRVLLNGMEERFDLLQSQGIGTMEDLYLLTKTKKKAEDLAETTGVDLDYMIVLRRMVSSYMPKPRKLDDYLDIDGPLLDRITELGIKNSIALYEYMLEKRDGELEAVLSVGPDKVKVIRRLLDVGQLRYISPAFATVLVRSGYDNIRKIAQADPADLHEAIVSTNKVQHIYKGNVGDSDARFLVDDAKVFLKYCG